MKYLIQLLTLSLFSCSASGDCGALPSFGNAAPVGYNATVSPVITEVNYVCSEGYEFDTGYNNKTITCLNTDQWSITTDSCSKVECPNLPTDGILSSSNNKYGDSVVMSCSDLLNFRVPGGAVGAPHTVTCTADKIWDGFDDSYNKGCIPIECVNPMPHSAGSNTLVSRGSTVKFTCNYGHYFSDDSVEKEFDCDNDGNWESGGTTNWTCDARECYDLPPAHNLTTVRMISKTRFIGEDVTFGCIDGHEFNDSSVEKRIACFANQTWSYIPFNCVARYCPPVLNITHGNASTDDNQYPSIVNYTCISPNTFPDGSLWRISQCNKYGKWSENIPNCGDKLNIGGEYEELLVETKGAQSYGITTMSLIGVLIAGIIIFDIVTFGRQIGFLKKNLNCVEPEDDADLDSLDGEQAWTGSTFSLGKGKVTPAASTVDLSYLNESKAALNQTDDVDVKSEEISEEEAKAKAEAEAKAKAEAEEEAAILKSSVPRTRLNDAKTSIQKAVTRINNAAPITRIRMISPVKKNDFAMAGLPLGADNYGKVIELRPPSPTKEESDSGSEYMDDDSDDEAEEAQV